MLLKLYGQRMTLTTDQATGPPVKTDRSIAELLNLTLATDVGLTGLIRQSLLK